MDLPSPAKARRKRSKSANRNTFLCKSIHATSSTFNITTIKANTLSKMWLAFMLNEIKSRFNFVFFLVDSLSLISKLRQLHCAVAFNGRKEFIIRELCIIGHETTCDNSNWRWISTQRPSGPKTKTWNRFGANDDLWLLAISVAS